jgi:hypothetical protein
MMKRLLAFALLLVLATSANATMPMLTPDPKPATPDSCRAWAAEQDEDAIDIWGIQEDGTSSPDVALQRLTDSCLGKDPPEIVGFGSSVGVNLGYCERHPEQKICVDFKLDYCATYPEEKICGDSGPR